MASARMNPTELGGPLLASVSRSFYLSIRLLPRGLRAPIGLAYLLLAWLRKDGRETL